MMAMSDAPGLNPNTIDLIGESADGTVQLFIVNDQPWAGTDEEITALQHKIHNYVSYALDGQMHRDHPDTVGAAWQIVIRSHAGPPDPRTSDVLERVRPALESYGGTLHLTP
jgi:hypothetical protein